jgi:hypothetical protein
MEKYQQFINIVDARKRHESCVRYFAIERIAVTHELYDRLFDIDAEVRNFPEDCYVAISDTMETARDNHTVELARSSSPITPLRVPQNRQDRRRS